MKTYNYFRHNLLVKEHQLGIWQRAQNKAKASGFGINGVILALLKKWIDGNIKLEV